MREGVGVNTYSVGKAREGYKTYFYVKDCEEDSIVVLPTQYLMHRIRAAASPNTVQRIAFSLSYYLTYMKENEITLKGLSEMSYADQHRHFMEFLYWIKEGRHQTRTKPPKAATCNTYLKDVLGWFQFMEIQQETFVGLKVLSEQSISFTNQVGLRIRRNYKGYKGYFKEELSVGRSIEREKIDVLISECTNDRDRLMIILLAETGFRIGELLGIRYTKDIDFSGRKIRVCFREDNANYARAKNAEWRTAKISSQTCDFLLYYIAENRNILKRGEYLFVNLSGSNIGEAENVNTVYAMFRRLEKKSGIKVTPHMLRHYFANERRRSGWDILLISKALGHRNISTTEKYLDVDTDELGKATDAYFENNRELFSLEELLMEE